MMKAPYCPGGESGLMSGTSPTHFSPFQTIPGRVGSQGLPSASAEARLYMMRRFAGQENAQLWNMPSPVGSALFLRCELFPDSVYTPECNQLPHMVDPSSWHCHWIQRAELMKLPSFSANPEQGSWNTSVWIFEASGPPYCLGAFQKVAVSIS